MDSIEDKEIVKLYLERNDKAIAYTKDKYGKRLLKLAFEITEDEQEAEECENDVYLKTWNSIPPHDPGNYLFRYLSRLLRNSALNRCRLRHSQKRQADTEELTQELIDVLPSYNGVEDTVFEHQLHDAINAFLSSLPQESRLVFVRRYWYMDTVERIAEGYGFSVTKVKSLLFRTRKKLRDYLEKEGYHI